MKTKSKMADLMMLNENFSSIKYRKSRRIESLKFIPYIHLNLQYILLKVHAYHIHRNEEIK